MMMTSWRHPTLGWRKNVKLNVFTSHVFRHYLWQWPPEAVVIVVISSRSDQNAFSSLQHTMAIDTRNSSILPRKGGLFKVHQVGVLLQRFRAKSPLNIVFHAHVEFLCCRNWQGTSAEMLASSRKTLRFSWTKVFSGTRWEVLFIQRFLSERCFLNNNSWVTLLTIANWPRRSVFFLLHFTW